MHLFNFPNKQSTSDHIMIELIGMRNCRQLWAWYMMEGVKIQAKYTAQNQAKYDE
jgi:hypothetical protein